MSDAMLFGMLRMPFDVAMSDDLSRLQFYKRVQQAADLLEEHATQENTAPVQPVAQMSGDDEINRKNTETLLHALEIIAVGDTADYKGCAAEALVEVGFWESKAASHPSNAVQDAPTEDQLHEIEYERRQLVEHTLWELLNALEDEVACKQYNGWVRHREPKDIRKDIEANLEKLIPFNVPATVPQVAQSVPSERHDFPNDVAHRYADFACDLVQWLRNVRDGISTIDDAVDNAERNMQSVRKFQAERSQPVAASPSIVPSDEQTKWQLFCDWWNKEIYGKKPAPEHRETFDAGFDACHNLLTTASNAGEAAQGVDK